MTSAIDRRIQRPDSVASRFVPRRLAYLARLVSVYALPSRGPLAFWHEEPKVNEESFSGDGSQYFMRFQGKAAYTGPFDQVGVPLLDYRGDIGRQYNPIAIAQYGLARLNQLDGISRSEPCGDQDDEAAWRAAADWLVGNLRPNAYGVPVWLHEFDWPYRQPLVAPWYSGLAQGNGLSLLVRAARRTGETRYAEAAHAAYHCFTIDVSAGGVVFTDDHERTWIEEYLVDPPSHILNGFIWALWGVFDYSRWTGEPGPRVLFRDCTNTLLENLHRYDTGEWSLYELPDSGSLMPASSYYHRLHVTQLCVMHRLTGHEIFNEVADRWNAYSRDPRLRYRAFLRKAWFKLRHY